MVKNPNCQEADQLAIYKHGRGVELGSTEKHWLQRDLNPRPRRFRARRPNHFAMLPPQTFNKQAKANTTEIALLTYAAAQLLISCSIFIENVSPRKERERQTKVYDLFK